MALFRRNNNKQVTKMTFEQLQDRLAELTQARFVIDVELSEVLGEIKNMETLATVTLNEAIRSTNVKPYQFSGDFA